MKLLFPVIALFASPVARGMIVDGTGFFPVVVVVMRPDGVTPAQGVSVRLADLPKYRETELDPQKRQKVLASSLGKPVQTDDRGCAVVFFHGRFSSEGEGQKNVYSQSLNGTVVVERNHKEVFRVSLKDWAKSNGFSPRGNGAPVVTVVLEPKDHSQ